MTNTMNTIQTSTEFHKGIDTQSIVDIQMFSDNNCQPRVYFSGAGEFDCWTTPGIGNRAGNVRVHRILEIIEHGR
ncbi:MAG: hypothetical protein LBN40_00155 [Oscillospiraceae bacterium]|nr:hypothetical protein [Oscillospiraceae bacterium]